MMMMMNYDEPDKEAFFPRPNENIMLMIHVTNKAQKIIKQSPFFPNGTAIGTVLFQQQYTLKVVVLCSSIHRFFRFRHHRAMSAS